LVVYNVIHFSHNKLCEKSLLHWQIIVIGPIMSSPHNIKKTNGVYRFTSATMKVTPSSFTLSGSNHLL